MALESADFGWDSKDDAEGPTRFCSVTSLGPFDWELYFLLLIRWSYPLPIGTIAGMASFSREEGPRPQIAQGWEGLRGSKNLTELAFGKGRFPNLTEISLKAYPSQTTCLVFQRQESGDQNSLESPAA